MYNIRFSARHRCRLTRVHIHCSQFLAHWNCHIPEFSKMHILGKDDWTVRGNAYYSAAQAGSEASLEFPAQCASSECRQWREREGRPQSTPTLISLKSYSNPNETYAIPPLPHRKNSANHSRWGGLATGVCSMQKREEWVRWAQTRIAPKWPLSVRESAD